jgi:hypothetical protein
VVVELTKNEVAGLLAVMEGETALLARLLYRTGTFRYLFNSCSRM